MEIQCHSLDGCPLNRWELGAPTLYNLKSAYTLIWPSVSMDLKVLVLVMVH